MADRYMYNKRRDFGHEHLFCLSCISPITGTGEQQENFSGKNFESDTVATQNPLVLRVQSDD